MEAVQLGIISFEILFLAWTIVAVGDVLLAGMQELNETLKKKV